jgi:hypothetical protein
MRGRGEEKEGERGRLESSGIPLSPFPLTDYPFSLFPFAFSLLPFPFCLISRPRTMLRCMAIMKSVLERLVLHGSRIALS